MDRSLNNILVATSLGEASDAVVRVALSVARAAGARLSLVHGFDVPAQFYGDFVTGQVWADEQSLRAHETWVQERLDAQVARLGITPAELAQALVLSGPSHAVITDAARAAQADLIVVGATEHGRSARLLGSTADRVIRQAVVPVLVARGEPAWPPPSVLAPVDLSDLSAEAFASAVTVLQRSAGGTAVAVDALFVLSPHQRDSAPQFTAEQVERQSLDELDRFVASSRAAAPVVVRTEVRRGRAADVIAAALTQGAYTLVALGTHGRAGFERFLTGSVAMDVVRDAPCSALVVPPAAAHAAATAAGDAASREAADFSLSGDADS
jgi:nucleotide-binding universal stress UspA family protein